MPRAEDNDLEYGQRHGLMDDERVISGRKRICYCLGYTQGVCDKCFLPYFPFVLSWLCMVPVVYLLGYYYGYISNHHCDDGSN